MDFTRETLAAPTLCGLLMIGLLALTGCSSDTRQDQAAPKTGSLTRTLDMMDKDGRRYGTVEMDPVGGGKVYDAEGRVIGTINRPDR